MKVNSILQNINIKTGFSVKAKGSVEEKAHSVKDSVDIDFTEVPGKFSQKPEDKPGEAEKISFYEKHKVTDQPVPLYINLDPGDNPIQKKIMGYISPDELVLNIKHTDDVHGNMPHVASLIQPDEFWIDSGDIWQNYTFHSVVSGGLESVDLMNKGDCDIAIPGNHFYDDAGKKGGDMLVEKANFPYLSSNVKGMKPYTIADVEGIKMAFIGVRTPRKRYGMVDPSLVKDVDISDPIEAVRKSVEEVKAKGVKNIIVLSHLGLEPTEDKADIISDKELAAKVPDIDLIIGGHTHTPTYKEVVVNGTRIVHAGPDDHGDANKCPLYVGDLSLTFDRSTGKIASINHKLIPVDREKKLPEDINSIHTGYVRETERILDEHLGTASGEFSHDVKTPVDSTLGNLLTDAMRKSTGADIALLDSNFFTNCGKYEGPKFLPAGEVKMKDLIKTSPWMGEMLDTRLETWNVKGKVIKEVLEEGVNKLLGPKEGEGLFQVAGLEMEYNPCNPEGERVTRIIAEGKTLNPDKDYKITTTYYQGNWNKFLKDRNDDSVEDGNKLRLAVADYIKEAGTVKPLEEGRIKITP